MINVLKAYCEEFERESIVVTGQLSQSRKAMGWAENGPLFKQHRIIPDNEWDETGKKLIDEYSDRLHIFNGITHPERMTKLIRYASEKGIAFCNMSEAYFNLESGWRKVIKRVYLNCLLPFKTRSIAGNSLGVICLSGSSSRDIKQFQNLGFRKDDIYPFGYYTQVGDEMSYKQAADGKIHILCPGLLEPYKGVDILVKALNVISSRGVRNFVCHITGKGSMMEKLQLMVNRFGLNDCVKLEGVMDAASYSSLISNIDVLVAPGRVEPWGIRINEAIQRGQAVIVSDGLGASSLIEMSAGGRVFHTGDHHALATALEELLTNNKHLALARHNNLSFRNEIDCKAQAKRLHSHIKDIIAKHPSLKQ